MIRLFGKTRPTDETGSKCRESGRKNEYNRYAANNEMFHDTTPLKYVHKRQRPAGYVSCKPGWLFLIKFDDRMLFFREHFCKFAADVKVLADKLFRNKREPLV